MLRAPVREWHKCEPDQTYLDTEVQRSVEPKAAWIRFRSCCRDRSGSFEVPQKSRSPFHGLACLRLPRGEVNVVRSCCYKQNIGASASTGSFIRIQSAAMRASFKQKTRQQGIKKPACASRRAVAYRLSQQHLLLLSQRQQEQPLLVPHILDHVSPKPVMKTNDWPRSATRKERFAITRRIIHDAMLIWPSILQLKQK